MSEHYKNTFIIDDRPWLSMAKCKTENIVDRDRFFELKGGVLAMQAIKICRKCEVKQECLDFALKQPSCADQYGIMGGTTQAERRAMRQAS